LASSPADGCRAHTCTHTHTQYVVCEQSSVSMRAQVAMVAATPHSQVTTHAADEDDMNDEDLCVVELPLTTTCVVVIAVLVVAIEFGNWCLAAWVAGVRRLGARGTTTGTATTRLRVVAACVGRLWRTFAWTQLVSCRCSELWLCWRVFDGCSTGCAEPRAGGVRVVAGRIVLARVVLALPLGSSRCCSASCWAWRPALYCGCVPVALRAMGSCLF
jgi:hypothetical protein